MLYVFPACSLLCPWNLLERDAYSRITVNSIYDLFYSVTQQWIFIWKNPLCRAWNSWELWVCCSSLLVCSSHILGWTPKYQLLIDMAFVWLRKSKRECWLCLPFMSLKIGILLGILLRNEWVSIVVSLFFRLPRLISEMICYVSARNVCVFFW